MKFIMLLGLCLAVTNASAIKKGCIYGKHERRINCRDAGLQSFPFEFLKTIVYVEGSSPITLDLGINNITSLTGIEEILNLRYRDQIKTILLDHNQISELPHNLFGTFSNLEYLDLSFNLLKRIPRRFCHMRALTDLILKGNPVEAISKKAFDCLPGLQYLSLANCGLTKVPTFGKPLNLEVDLTGNHIHEFVKPTPHHTLSLDFPRSTLKTPSKTDNQLAKKEKEKDGTSGAATGSTKIFFVVILLCCIPIFVRYDYS